MNYFKLLGLIFGAVALLKPVYMHVLPWDENKFISKAYQEKRPGWILPAALVSLTLVGFTWYKHFTADIAHSIVLTVLFSLSAIKGLVLIFDYKTFYQWVAKMLKKDKGRDIILIDIGAGVFGAVLIILTFILY